MKKTMRMVGTLALAFTFTITAACGKADEHDSHGPHGDIQEKTASIQTLPSFLDSQREEIRTAYRLAAQSAELLQWIPCYCGCGESSGHRSNENCFIQKIEADGSVVWDDHGTRCGVCMQIAVTTYQLKEQGKSAKDIRQTIDATYKTGYAKPTPTPMPN
ncbi:PCYCGC motif-containing (lipo)protein [Paenibacillus hodogayensis]|uniref:PCYCGC motif-containing (Lipo)protein n=1 Tax=Paenibacillus hodogayensis TaxID=279208 RepID=A0ABV5W2C6_9BACL